MSLRIGFISTRFAGTDGVSLESLKWAQVLKEDGHDVFWFAGKIDRAPEVSMCVPEAHFAYSENEAINKKIWGKTTRSPKTTQRIHTLAQYLKLQIDAFVRKFDIDVLVAQNVLTIPMHVPLGIALTEYLSENDIPTISHHHDFYWERDRFLINAIPEYLEMAFPARGHNIDHVVINQTARESLSWRKGVSSILVPNVLDFDSTPPGIDDYNKDVRQELGIAEDELLLLQPTRIVPRKGIEHAINLVEMLNIPKCKLVISHEAGDEGTEYLDMLKDKAAAANVDLLLIDDRVGEQRQLNNDGQKIYTLWDIYPHADFITYPSLYEGFGNALLEAFYYKIPVLVNRYSIYTRDIEPKGFRVVTMDGILTQKKADVVKNILSDDDYRNELVEHNFELAQKFFSYRVLRRKLRSILANLMGDEISISD